MVTLNRTANLVPVKSEPRPAGRKVILGICLSFSLKAHITLNITKDQIFLTEKSWNYGILFMKTFYNVVNAIICCAKEARALMVVDIE